MPRRTMRRHSKRRVNQRRRSKRRVSKRRVNQKKLSKRRVTQKRHRKKQRTKRNHVHRDGYSRDGYSRGGEPTILERLSKCIGSTCTDKPPSIDYSNLDLSVPVDETPVPLLDQSIPAPSVDAPSVPETRLNESVPAQSVAAQAVSDPGFFSKMPLNIQAKVEGNLPPGGVTALRATHPQLRILPDAGRDGVLSKEQLQENVDKQKRFLFKTHLVALRADRRDRDRGYRKIYANKDTQDITIHYSKIGKVYEDETITLAYYLDALRHLPNLQRLKIKFDGYLNQHGNPVDRNENTTYDEPTSLPEEIGNCRGLVELDVSGSFSIRTLPDTLGYLTKLTKLNLANNSLTELPESIGSLEFLNTLDLTNKSLTSLPESMRQLPLGSNEGIGNLGLLHYLYLGGNELKELPPSIGTLNLWTLNLSGNKLTTLPDMGSLTKTLFKLHIGDNSLQEIPQSVFTLKGLTELYLYGNELTELPPEIGGLDDLRR